MERLKAKLFL